MGQSGGIEAAINRIINSPSPPSPPTGFQMTPNMMRIAQQNPSLAGQNFAGATTAGAMPGAPNTAQMSQMAGAQPQGGGGGAGSAAFGPLAGAGLGYMAGGPRGAMQGLGMGGGEALAMGGHPELGLPLMMATQLFGGGGQQPQPPQMPGIHPSQSQIQPGITGGGGGMNPMLMKILGMG